METDRKRSVLSYDFDRIPTTASKVLTTLRFVELVDGPPRTCRRYSFHWEASDKLQRHWEPDVSSTIYLLRGGGDPLGDASHSGFIERNVSGLLAMHHDRAAKVDGSMVL